MIIAVLKETADYERRVALTPSAAQKLTAGGTKIKMEKGAGKAAGFADKEYENAGIEIAEDAAAALKGASLLFKIRAPSAEEIAQELDMTEEDVKESLKNSGRHISMDAPLVEGEDSNLYDVLKSGESPNPDRELMNESLRIEIERALQTLTPREADVIRLYFGLGGQHTMTLEEIGETFDLTRERVRQIKEKAIRRLKHTSRSKILKTYLG